MEEFLQKQAAREAGSGDAPLPTTGATPGGAVVGADIVPDDVRGGFRFVSYSRLGLDHG